jgi:hypothetical protein
MIVFLWGACAGSMAVALIYQLAFYCGLTVHADLATARSQIAEHEGDIHHWKTRSIDNAYKLDVANLELRRLKAENTWLRGQLANFTAQPMELGTKK